MSSDQNNLNQPTTESSATVIIGAGPVGLLLAHELMKQGKKVILVEAGGETIQAFSTNEYANVGHTLSGASTGRMKGLGGTTNVWGGQLTEFIANDINETEIFDQPAWPISWEEVSKYYAAVYKKLGFNNLWSGQTEKLTSSERAKYLEIFHTRWLKRPNFRSHFLQELMDSDLVTIHSNATVTNLTFKGNKCCSLDITTQGNKEHILNFGNVVLANGTIEICRLLLIAAKSGNCPFKQNQLLGKFFQDHINLRVGQITNPSKSFFGRFSNIIRNGEKFQPKIRTNNKIPNDRYLGISGIFAFDSNVSHHIDNFKQFSKSLLGQSHQKTGFMEMLKMFVKIMGAIPQITLIIYNYVKNNRIYIPFNSKVSLTIQAQQISIARSNISISETEFDNLGRPKALVNWQIDGREFNEIRDFCLSVKEYLDNNGLGKLQFEKWFENECENSDGSWIKQIFDSYHQAGGTIMAQNSNTGVVDHNMKVYDTDNVYVCGACAMPTSSYANTSFTALTLSMRLSNYLSRR